MLHFFGSYAVSWAQGSSGEPSEDLSGISLTPINDESGHEDKWGQTPFIWQSIDYMRKAKRSPLRENALRDPGQSLKERRFDLAFDRILGPTLLAVFFTIYAAFEWWWYFQPQRPHPLFHTIVAGLLITYAIVQIWRTWPRIQALRLATEGEKVVGQFLEKLRVSGYEVFHDILGSEFNVDHVLIGSAGVFTIETKTYSKPVGRDARVVCDAERILVDGLEPERNPLVQAKAQAGWLRALLKDSTGKDFSVRPVVVSPGWYVEQSQESRRDVWVLEPKALPGFVSYAPRTLSDEDIKLASYHLKRFILAVETERGPKATTQ